MLAAVPPPLVRGGEVTANNKPTLVLRHDHQLKRNNVGANDPFIFHSKEGVFPDGQHDAAAVPTACRGHPDGTHPNGGPAIQAVGIVGAGNRRRPLIRRPKPMPSQPHQLPHGEGQGGWRRRDVCSSSLSCYFIGGGCSTGALGHGAASYPAGVLSSLSCFLHMQSFSGSAQLFLTACVRCWLHLVGSFC